MNDFTKDELEIILEGILWRDNHVNPNERPEKLKSKIQSMIDNYCEHDWRILVLPNESEIYGIFKCSQCWKVKNE